MEKDKVLKFTYLIYEFLGTALITVAYNMAAKNYAMVLLVVSIWSWNVSAAHFNMAITLG